MQYRCSPLPLLGLCLMSLTAAWTAPAAVCPDEEVEVVVTATRTETPVEEVASSITVITEEQIEATQEPLVVDVLREVPGLYVSQTGGPGRTVDVYLRGAGPGQTLVMLDGVELNDPISSSRAYDLANMTVDNIARIEVLRGPQSTLYGSDAVAGVINIITKRGTGDPQTSVTLDGGSFNTGQGRLTSSGAVNDWNYSFSGSRYVTDGFSAASEWRGNPEDDGYTNTTLSTRIGRRVNDNLSIDLIGRYIDGAVDVDGWSMATGSAADDLLNITDTEQWIWRGEGRWCPGGGCWEHIIGISSNRLARDYTNEDGPGEEDTADQSSYTGSSMKYDWQANYAASASHCVTVGIEHEEDHGEFTSAWSALDEQEVRTTGYYAQDQITLQPNWFATLGLRLDDHETFGAETTYRVTSSYHLSPSTRLNATYGTGFKAPTLYQLYDPYNGNIDLLPEESTSLDAGIEQEFLDGCAALSVTYFENDFDNLIQWLWDTETMSGRYQNASTAESSGVEVVAAYRPSAYWQFDVNYTNTKTAGPNGQPLARRPRHQYGAVITYHASPRFRVNLNGVWVGERLDKVWEPTPVTLPSYTLVNLAGTYQVNTTTSAYFRIDNLFGEDYEEVYGYGTSGRALNFGMTYTF